MSLKHSELPPLTDAVIASITQETHYSVTNHMNNTPEECNGSQPGENTFTLKIAGQLYSATKEQLMEVSARKGLQAESKEFLTKNFPDKFGTAQA